MQSKVGSLDNARHRAGGGEKKVRRRRFYTEGGAVAHLGRVYTDWKRN